MADQCVTIAKLVQAGGNDEPGLERRAATRSRRWAGAASACSRPRRTRSRTATPSARAQLDELDNLVDDLNRTVVEQVLEIGGDRARREWGLRMVLVARALERIADNAVDIAEQVCYVVDRRAARVQRRLASRRAPGRGRLGPPPPRPPAGTSAVTDSVARAPGWYNDPVHSSLTLIVIVVGTALVLRLHERLPRHRERDGDDHRHARAAAAHRGRRSRRCSTSSARSSRSRSPRRSRSGIVDQNLVTVPIVFAGLVGAILWNLVTWYFSIPSSSSHALIGGVLGAMIAAVGTGAVVWSGILAKVIIPALLAPFICGGVGLPRDAALVRADAERAARSTSSRGFRLGQVASSSLVALAHGTNDAQKTMGVVTLTLIAGGRLGADEAIPVWVKVVVRRRDRGRARSRAAGA